MTDETKINVSATAKPASSKSSWDDVTAAPDRSPAAAAVADIGFPRRAASAEGATAPWQTDAPAANRIGGDERTSAAEAAAAACCEIAPPSSTPQRMTMSPAPRARERAPASAASLLVPAGVFVAGGLLAGLLYTRAHDYVMAAIVASLTLVATALLRVFLRR